MKQLAPIIECWLIAGLLLSGAPAALAQSDPVGDESSAERAAVLLSNDQVLHGLAQQQGDRIVIKQDDGAVIRLPIDSVLCWGPDLQALYQFRIDRRERPTVRSHLIEARWCLNNGLQREAANELMSLYQLSPNNAEAQRLEQRLRRISEAVQPTAAEEPVGAESERDHMHVSIVATQHFTRVIQPILINRCGSCHDTNTDSKFSLLRLPGVSRVSSAMTHRNLQHVLGWIDTSDPLASPLLEYAQQGHGGSDLAPLGKSQAKAFESLAYWCMMFDTGKRNEQVAARPISTHTAAIAAVSPFDQQSTASLIAAEAQALPGREPIEPIGDSQPRRLPALTDPFDPEIFNRKHHPQRRR